VRTVSALNAQPDVINKYRVFLFKAMQVGITKGLKVGAGNGGLFCACFFTYALGFWYGGKLVADSISDGCTGSSCPNGGEDNSKLYIIIVISNRYLLLICIIRDEPFSFICAGKILSVFFCTIMGSMALGQIAPPMIAFISAKAAVRSVLDVINRKPLIDGLSAEGDKPDQRPLGAIEIKNVNFAYPSRPNITVCKDYDLKIAPGESVALVGVSGCGKSTIINLLLRFYDPQSGVVSLDGHDIKKLNIRWLRNQIGYVGQEPVLFSGTVADNISYGLPPELLGETAELVHPSGDASSPAVSLKLSKEELRERVVAAAKLANAHDFISEFPQNYDTDVGSNGAAMSGGQKQRIAIARALIKKPSVLLLDEATSALDATSERVVQESIDALQRMKAQTTIIIAHRLSTIRNADKICLINQGQIAEMGTHDELIARNGLYADLVRLQMSGHDDLPDQDALITPEIADVEGDSDIPPGAPGSSPAGSDRKRATSQASVGAAVVPGGSGQYNSEREMEPLAPGELSKEESQQASRRIWAMIREHTGWLIVGCLGAAVFGGIFPSWGLMLAYSQNMFFLADPNDIREKASLYAYLYIMLGVVSLFSATGQFYGVAQVAERVSLKLRSCMFEALMRREIGFFDLEENSIGTLTTRLSDDSRVVNKAFGESLARQLQAFFTLAVGLILGFRASWKVALVVIAAFPINIIAGAIQMQAFAGQQYEGTILLYF
jgi:ATP-binding cassette subfamily B (MDR/TAP) protein 1